MNTRRKLIWQFNPFYLILGLLVTGLSLLIARTAYVSAMPDAPHDAWMTSEIVAWSIGAGLLAAITGICVIVYISRSIETTRRGAQRFADGDLTFQLDIPQSVELAGLAETLNYMAAQLNERISTINRQRQEQEAMLGSMVEGVIAVDKDATIFQANKSAAHVFGMSPTAIIGRSLFEMIRHHDLQNLMNETLEKGISTEGEIQLHGTNERSLQIYCTPLLNAKRVSIGALMVVHDITRIRRLEIVRRDFVANVSHELKTPLTSIKGFVETLLDGALEQPEEAKRFCTIIAKQVNRLQAIIEDLLSLSRIEQEAEQGQVSLKMAGLLEALQAGVQCCAHQASEKNISVVIDCDPSWTVRLNAPLFEQVVVNLIDNAIKYSDKGKTVTIRVTPNEAMWEIRFIDQGNGMESTHLVRIFERFYRIDKSRNSKVDGTGLGLAIVKHIVTSHGGRIQVESKLGVGSTFTIYLPR